MMDKILLTGMRFWGFHGVLEAEQALGQVFIIDLELRGDFGPAGVQDSLEQAVNYAEVYQTVKDMVEGERYRLIEALAERIAARILAEFSVQEVLVRVNKPHAPISGPFSNVAIELVRERGYAD